jgi:acetyl esterase
MALDPQAKAYLDALVAFGAPPPWEQVLAELRQAGEVAAPDLFGPVPSVPFEDREIPGPGGPIRVRVYSPGEGEAPVLVYFHGGGWVVGSLSTHHGTCATLAADAGCSVVSVDYRLAPENRYPAALDDAWAATLWASAHAPELGGRPGALAVGGDSSGGNLAAVVAVRARDNALPLRHQLLVYPVCDADLETLSYLECAEGCGLTRSTMRWFWEQYVPVASERFAPEASPLRAADVGGTAPAHVLTAEYDVLRDEGEAYARRLEAAGVPVTLSRYDGQIHGFFRMAAVIDRARDALSEAAGALRNAFAH